MFHINAELLRVSLMAKLSSKQLDDLGAFPLVCDQCGAFTVVPCYDGTMVGATFFMLGLRCSACGQKEYIVERVCRPAVWPKPDRRRNLE
jgi:hypothetical protein